MRKPYKRKMWGGFCDGRLHLWSDGIVGGYPKVAIFTSKSAAKKKYEDVRRIEVREVHP